MEINALNLTMHACADPGTCADVILETHLTCCDIDLCNKGILDYPVLAETIVSSAGLPDTAAMLKILIIAFVANCLLQI